jgi:hypothetical protein
MSGNLSTHEWRPEHPQMATCRPMNSHLNQPKSLIHKRKIDRKCIKGLKFFLKNNREACSKRREKIRPHAKLGYHP